MAEFKMQMQAFQKKPVADFVKDFSSKSSKMDTGSCSTAIAAMSFAFLSRACSFADVTGNEELAYIARNCENLSNYMVQLIDEDIKCRTPITIAMMEKSQDKIDACLQPACAINAEIINMMLKALEFAKSLKFIVPDEAKQYVLEASDLALTAIKMSRTWILERIKVGSEETFDFVTKRENEIYLQQAEELYGDINK